MHAATPGVQSADCIGSDTVPEFTSFQCRVGVSPQMQTTILFTLTKLTRTPALLATATLVAHLASTALAQTIITPVTIDFNDLGPTTGGVHMPPTYEGLEWGTSDWHYMTLASTPADDFLALSGTGTAFHSTGGEDFYFDGADFWSRRGLDANGRFYFVLCLLYTSPSPRD